MTLTVDGIATKGSVRSLWDRRSGAVRTLPDCRSLDAWTLALRWRAKEAGVPCLPRPAPVIVTVRCSLVPPACDADRLWHTGRPDVDKVLRAVLDALTGIAYEDDAQVVAASVVKHPGPLAQVTIDVEAAQLAEAAS